MLRYKYFYILFFFIVILCFSFYENAEMMSITYSKLELDSDVTTLRYMLALCILCGVFCLFHPRPRMFFSGVFTAMVIFVWVISTLHQSSNVFGWIAMSTNILMPLVMLYYFYQVAQTIEDRYFYDGLLLVSLIMLYAFWNTYQVQLINSLTDEVRATSLYIYLFILPFFLLSKNTTLRWGSVVFVAGSMVLSLKRGGAVSFAASLLVYYFVNSYCTKGKVRIKEFLLMLSVLVIIYLVITWGMQNYFDELFLRLESMSEDEGSNRLEVYETTWWMIAKSDMVSLWLGHGWNMVVEDSPIYLSAHNDFLEVLYDFGIPAFCLYVYFVYRLYKSMFQLIRWRSSNAAPFAFSVITFTVNSTVAHILIYPFNFIAIAAVWGYILGKEKQSLKLARL